MKQASLSDIALEMGVNKSKLAYYFTIGLLKQSSLNDHASATKR